MVPNLEYMNIKSISPAGVRYAFIPDSNGKSFRDSQKNQWSWRLSASMQHYYKQGWKFGFFTLTYNEKSLPHIPYEFFRGDKHDVPCFNRDDIKYLVHSLREYFWKKHSVKGLVYFIAGEYGGHTRRPHYHGIIGYPPSIDGRLVHHLIKKFWCKRGYLFPAVFEGGVDSKSHFHKPFEIGFGANEATEFNIVRAGRYAGKYACKDLFYTKEIAKYDFRKVADCSRVIVKYRFGGKTIKEVVSERKKLSWFLSFHVQSRSLGAEALIALTDFDKMNLVRHGMLFCGDANPKPIPLYIKNKLFFDNYYVLDKFGKRLCRRYATSFMMDNRKEIFDNKVNFYEKIFCQMQDASFWKLKKDAPFGAHKISSYIRSAFSEFSLKRLASFYVAGYGVRWRCLSGDLNEDDWICRFIPVEDIDKLRPIRTYFDVNEYASMYSCITFVMDFLHFVDIISTE